VRKMKKAKDKGMLEKEVLFWNVIKKSLGKNAAKRCHK
jgi:hypothetical protein